MGLFFMGEGMVPSLEQVVHARSYAMYQFSGDVLRNSGGGGGILAQNCTRGRGFP